MRLIQYLFVQFASVWTAQTVKATCNIEVNTSSIKWSKRLTGNLMMTLIEIPLEKCVEQCIARPKCNSINYRRLFHVCELNEGQESSEMTTFDKYKGIVSLDRKDRQKRQICLDNGCNGYRKCQLGNDLQYEGCFYAECPPLAPAPPLHINDGAVNWLGGRVKYHCETGFTLVGDRTRQCFDNGTWSGSEPSCDCDEENLFTWTENDIVGSDINGSYQDYACDCLRRCLQHPDCKSLDYLQETNHKGWNCYIKHKGLADNGIKKTNFSWVEHYERN